MSITRTWTLAFSVLVAIFTGPTAWAEPAPDSGDAVVFAEPEAQLTFARESQAEVATVVARLATVLKTKEGDLDPKELQCLATRLVSAQALSSVTSNGLDALSKAIVDGETEQARFEVRKSLTALGKSRALLIDAQQCVMWLDVVLSDLGEQPSPLVSDNPDEVSLDVGLAPPSVSPFR
ncbi:MAG: hypothetical protein AAGA48_03210 [Myxococcota bacterium]